MLYFFYHVLLRQLTNVLCTRYHFFFVRCAARSFGVVSYYKVTVLHALA